MTDYIFTSNRSDKEYQRLRLLESAFDKKMHLTKGRSTVANVMGASVRTLKKQYIQTGECNETDIDNYVKGTEDPKSVAIY